MNNLGNMSIHDGMQNMGLPVRYIHGKQMMKSEINKKKPVAFVPGTNTARKVLPITQTNAPIFHLTDIKPAVHQTIIKPKTITNPRLVANGRARKNALRQNPFSVVENYDEFAIKKEQNLKQLVAEYEANAAFWDNEAAQEALLDAMFFWTQPIIICYTAPYTFVEEIDADKRAENLQKLVAEYEHEHPTRLLNRNPNVSSDVISTMKAITAVKLYDVQMEQDYDNWECDRDMTHYFRELSAAQVRKWTRLVAPKTIAYCKILRVYGKKLGDINESNNANDLDVAVPETKYKPRKTDITPAQMRKMARPDKHLTNQDLKQIVYAWNGRHMM